MVLGVHVRTEGNICNTFGEAQKLGCNTMQFFSRSPQQWRQRRLKAEVLEQFRTLAASSKISPIFIHIPYLINLASPDRKLYGASIHAYIEDIREAELLGVDYIVTHMGSHKNTSEPAGLRRLTRALDRILEKTKNSPVGILLENTAGSGSWLGHTFKHQKKVLAGLSGADRVALCLDTAHAHLAGYDLATKSGFEKTMDQIDTLVGLSKIKLIHLNDAKNALGSRHDQHAHIGGGTVGMEGIGRIVNFKPFYDTPFILETPKDTKNADKKNLRVVRRLRKE